MDYDKNARTGGEMAPDNNAPPPYSDVDVDGDSSNKPSQQPQNTNIRFSLEFLRSPPGLLMLINIVSLNTRADLEMGQNH